MVKHVSIQNFKSIKSLEFEARRVNVFIGEPNTGKSNILEGLGGLSSDLRYPFEAIRSKFTEDIFWDKDSSLTVSVKADAYRVEVMGDIEGDTTWSSFEETNTKSPVRYYIFGIPESFLKTSQPGYLLPVHGKNLFGLIKNHTQLRENVSFLFQEMGHQLGLRLEEAEIELIKQIEDGVIHSYAYTNLSNTLQRFIFYTAAIQTNKKSILLFEEPEANSFPPYTKQLAEWIAADESNQYFIATHSPYLLNTLVQKTPTVDLNVFITYMEDYQTKIRRFSDEELSDILDLGEAIFFNLDRYLDPDATIHR